jgi:plasmid stabilization system protein ParE
VKRLLWQAQARADLAKITDHFAANDPRIGATLLDRIHRAAQALAKRDTGRPGRMPNLREKSVARTKYILAYRVMEKQVVILRIIHAAQDWTGSSWPEG